MPKRYTAAHANPQGAGDSRPTALQIIEDENLINALPTKTILITGASSGIGVETARALVATGATIYLGVRSLSKGRDACRDFLDSKDNDGYGRVHLLEIDLKSLGSVRKAAETFLKESGGKLNVLVNNAGIMATPYSKTVDGFESQFGVNHLAHFLLFQLLKPALLASSTPEFNSRVVNVSSSGHRANAVFFDDLNFDKGIEEYAPFKGYGQAKTANIWMANEIENRYGAKGLHGLSLHPGGIWTGLQTHVSEETMKQWKSLPNVDNIIKSEAQGAATTVFAAVGEELEGRGRLYLCDCDVATPGTTGENHAAHAFDKEREAKLWKASYELVGVGGDP